MILMFILMAALLFKTKYYMNNVSDRKEIRFTRPKGPILRSLQTLA